ncbi:HAMP domain-containing protein [Mucilaginibacter sp. UR6-1]|uniref:HAMP domain-containing sensor histidine kinase n=1 Tax=Mucilaginibacter sp. UR6-1 TaxID=1435643 RepID=UPI001E2C6C33|nr:ATP-binding protein [Mucilaginibacter sp. UR6-1]MCC8409187.1 HAMP domain-containing protein [Mucilaginibacter sp. UR6-1]
MKIKTKLRLGFGFLFAVVIFFGALSLFYINEIAKSSQVILKDNYETLRYIREMRRVLDEQSLPLNKASADKFSQSLLKEKNNITETGEREAVERLTAAFNKITSGKATIQLDATERQIRAILMDIEDVNMRAIVRKHAAAQASVQKTTVLLGFAGTITFLILFSFSVNFPGFISGPLRKLQEGISEISRKNYATRLGFRQDDEFADVAQAFNNMATRLRDWENSNLATVLSEKRRIEAIIEQMQDAIIGVNEKQEILFINTAAKNILSLYDDRPEGKLISELTRQNDLMRSIIDEQVKAKPFKIVVDGKESHFQLQTREISVPNMKPAVTDGINLANTPAGKVYILENITEFKERDEAKTNFIATISHELKTPISSIRLSLKLLNDQRIGPVNEEQRQLVHHIEEDTNRLLKITSELLELSQVETGNIQLNFVPAEPAQIVDYAIDSVKFQAGQKGVALEVLTDDNLPKVRVDMEKTAWVLVNFLSNALRYSPEKSKVIIRVTKHGQWVEFSVKDMGKGIDEQFQKRLFDRYFQVPTDGQNKSGSGLGLAISKDFIEVQQGRIGLESALGEGSRFYFLLPAV